jgi:hypothetical protein
MSSIDERIVQMRFDNKQFEQGVKTTTDSLGKLKDSLNLDTARKGLQALKDIGSKFTLTGIGEAIDGIASKFNALTGAAAVAFGNIATQAINAGTQIAKSLTIDPITTGLREYETNLNGIQTILANTKGKGENLQSVNDALDNLNAYSDKTIYNFSQMVNGIKTLTTAGANLQGGVDTVKGFANAAALAGVGANEMASALTYGLTQAITKGRMMTQDWMSLETSGIAGESFKNSIMETARVNGIAVDDIIARNGSFRESLSEGWLTADILQQTLAKYTGEMTDMQLKQLGYTDEQIKSIQELAATAVESATKVKTMSQLIGTLQEAAGSGWAKTWQILFGDLEEARTLFTNVSNVIGGMIQASAEARNKLLGDWKVLGGRTVLIEAIGIAFNSLTKIVNAVKDAFVEIYPPATGRQLFNITKAFKEFVERFKAGNDIADKIRRTFAGVFAVFDIVFMVIKGLGSVLGKVFGPLMQVGGGILGVTAKIGDFLVKVRDAIKSGEGLGNVFSFIGDVLKAPIELLNKLGTALTKNKSSADGWGKVWENILNVLNAVWDFLQPLIKIVGDAFKELGKATDDAMKNLSFDTLVGLINAGLLGGIFVVIKKFISGIKDSLGGIGGGIVSTIKETFGALSDTMQAFQNKLKADMLIRIAIAIGILTASVVILSLIDVAKLRTALVAITVMFVQMAGALALLDRMVEGGSVFRLTGLSTALILLATSLVIMASAVSILAKLDTKEMATGLAGLAGALTIMVVAVKVLSNIQGQLIGVSFGLILISTALVIMASAMTIFASLSWDDIGRGLTVLTGLLTVTALFTMVLGGIGGIAGSAFGLIIIAGALVILASAMKIMATMGWDDIGRSMVVLAGALAILAAGMYLMSAALPGAAALLIASVSLIALAAAMKVMGSMSWEEIGRGLTVLAGSLGILALGLTLMIAALPGAFALIVAAGALIILATALKIMGSMSWDEIGKSLAVLASALGILAGAGMLLIPALPGLIGLGFAILLIGTGVAVAAVGVTLFAAALAAMATAAAMGTAAIIFMVTQFIGLIPLIMRKIGEGIIQIAEVISTSGPQLIKAFVTVIVSLVTAIAMVTPLIVKTLFDLINLLLKTLLDNVPKFVDMGMKLITGILEGLGKNIQSLVEAGANLIVNYLNGIANKLPDIISAGINLVLSFVRGVADGISTYSAEFVDAGSKFFRAIVDGVAQSIEQGGADLRWAGERIGEAILEGAKAYLGIASPSKEFYKLGEYATAGIVNALNYTAKDAGKAGENVGAKAIDGLKKSITGINDAATNNIDMVPTIRPVLDLSAIKKDSSLIDGFLTPSALTVDAGYSKAASISVEQNAIKSDLQNQKETTQAQQNSTNISFVQNNNSPKALSPAEIYRQTKNQIALVKGVVKTV